MDCSKIHICVLIMSTGLKNVTNSYFGSYGRNKLASLEARLVQKLSDSRRTTIAMVKLWNGNNPSLKPSLRTIIDAREKLVFTPPRFFHQLALGGKRGIATDRPLQFPLPPPSKPPSSCIIYAHLRWVAVVHSAHG